MAKLFWNSSDVRSRSQAPFAPEDFNEFVSQLGELAGVELELRNDENRGGEERVFCPIRVGGRRVGWGVSAHGVEEHARRAADLASHIASRLFTADQDIASLAVEMTDRYEELNFLYSMSDRVGALLDEREICSFVVEEASWLMNCDRASIMVPDEDDRLCVRASVGLADEIARGVSVKPGEGISGRVFESGQGIIINEGDAMPADSLAVKGLRESNCFLSVPLKITSEGDRREEVVGVFNLTRKRGGSMFTASDLKLVSAVAMTTATQIHNCRLISAERERQRLDHEIELAARIQLSLLPKEPLCTGMLEVAGCCRPAQRVGGDLFDYWLRDRTLYLLVADVSGHDMGAALMATALRSVMRSETVHHQSVAGLMSRVNLALFEDLCNSELFISAFYGEVDLDSGEMTFCRAGHPKPLLVQNGRVEWLDTEGLLLGIAEDGGFEEGEVQLRPGDAVVFYTDGLVEANDGAEGYFGTEGVCRASLAQLSRPPREVSTAILEAARQHAGGGPLSDDMTAMVLRIRRAEGG